MSLKNWNKSRLFDNIRNNIHYKLFLTVILVMITLLILAVAISFYFSTNESYQEMKITNQSSMEMAQTYMQEKIANYDELLYSVLFDEQFINSFSQNKDESANFAAKQYIEDRLRNLLNSNPNGIECIRGYTKWDNRVVTLTDHQLSISYQHPEWTFQEYEGKSLLEANHDYFILKRLVNDFDTRELIGWVSMSVKWDEMYSAFEMLKNKKENILFIVDRSGEIIHNPYSGQTIPEDVSDSMKKGEVTESFLELDDYYVFNQPIFSDVYITKFVPKQSVLAGGHSIIKIGILIGMMAIVILLGFSLFFYWKVTNPIRQLAYEMENVVIDNFQTSIKVDQQRSDEIGILQMNFVEMVQKIKQLIETEYKHELEKQNAQFQALQHKINPHFLHNSLQLIGNTALSNEGRKVYEMIEALSQMFRYTLRANKDIAMIHEEVNHLKQYLYIQKQRFKDRLFVDLYVDEEVEQSTMPMLTLQPIIENAFAHGFTTDKKQWKIHISLEKVLDEIEIRVTDNGKGIDASLINKMNQAFEEEPKDLSYVKKSIGLQNVNNRLKLIYGKEYGVKIYSGQNKGAEIFIRIPLILDEWGGHNDIKSSDC